MSTNSDNDAIDTRIVFRTYAVIAWLVGVFLIAFGPFFFRLELAGLPEAGGLVVRIGGAMVVAAGCFAYPLALVDDPGLRRKALAWLSAGHGQVLMMVFVHGFGLKEEPGPAAQAGVAALLTVTLLLHFFWLTAEGIPQGGLTTLTTLFGNPGEPSIQRLRSAYEEQIRAAAGQEERNRLARDLHDSVKQQIFAIQTAAATAQARFSDDRSGASVAIGQVRESAREAMTEMEAMLEQLKAAPLENVGLAAALKKQCEALGFRTGAEVRFALGELPPSHSLPPGAQEVVFRVAQEALANVGRHARATHVTVTLDSTEHSLQLRVEDDGMGFEGSQSGGGMGLGNMRARAAAVGGTLAVTTQPGSGTLVRLSVPRAAPETDDIGYYRRRVLFWGLVFGFWIMYTVAGAISQSSTTLAIRVPLAVVFAVLLGRVAVAYVRVRRQQETR